jgi:hypothetical protein
MSDEASVTPAMSPLSCWGKNPLGIQTYSNTVTPKVTMMNISMKNWCSRTHLSPPA